MTLLGVLRALRLLLVGFLIFLLDGFVFSADERVAARAAARRRVVTGILVTVVVLGIDLFPMADSTVHALAGEDNFHSLNTSSW